MRELPVALRAYLWVVYAGAAIVIGIQMRALLGHGAPAATSLTSVGAYILFVALAYAGERTTLQVSGSVDQSLATPVHVAAILLFPPPFPILITLAAVAISQVGRRATPWYKRAFNIFHPTLAVGCTSAVATALAGPGRLLTTHDGTPTLAVLVVVIAVYYILDVGSLLGIIALSERQPPWEVWWRTYRRTLLPELATSAIGILGATMWRFDRPLLVLVLLPVIALRQAFRAITLAEDAQSHAELAHYTARKSDALKGAILDAALDAIITVDASGRTVEFNGAAERMFGYRANEAIERDLVTLIIPPQSRQQYREGMYKLLAEGEGPFAAVRVELTAQRSDGHTFPVEVGVRRIPTDERLVTAFIRDLTAQKTAELERARLLAGEQAARSHAERALRVRDEFLTSASHDLRTPLTGIVGRADLMSMRLCGDRDLDKGWMRVQVEALRAAARRMTTTVEEITDTAQLQMGHQLSLALESLDLVDVTATAARTVDESNAGKPAAPIVVYAAGPIPMQGDRSRLERVMQNIIGNAVKYSPSLAPVYVNVERRHEWAVVTVQDHGVGIPAEELPHIFNPFYRASTSIGIKGTGIGLAGSRTIAEQHGGRIGVESVAGKGTTVTVWLPAAAPGSVANEGDAPRTRVPVEQT